MSLVTLKRPTRRRAVPAAASDASVRPVGRRVYIETYGCQMNISDTELIAGVLAERGYLRVKDVSKADVILVNSCAIREHAEERVVGRLGQLQAFRKRRPEVLLGVTGCMAQRLGAKLLGRAAVDLVAGPDAYRRLGELVEEIQTGALERGQTLLELDATEKYEQIRSIRGEGTTAWITVQRGCDHRCTFCIVPYVRGSEKNRRPGEILAEARGAVEAGYTEVTLLGQTVNSYRWEEWGFADLLRAVSRTPGLRRVRFTSPHPNDVTRVLLETMERETVVCRQLHLPVQSGAERVLKRMVRRYTVREYVAKVELARAVVPGIALSTDVIVGFPGETDAEFEATLDLMREVRFDDAYLYRFSPREGTPATRFPREDYLPDDLSRSRLERLIDVQRAIQREINRAEVGQTREVLVERAARSEGDVLGRTEANKVVAFPGDPQEVGDYLSVRLLATSGATFVGERVA